MSMMWFGKKHPAPAYADCPQTETPVGRACFYCQEQIAMGDDGWILVDGHMLHRECSLRSMIGSVAHQQRRCSCYGGGAASEGESGMTRRQAAKAAMDYFQGRQ
jgi:hypothetical protein